HRALNERNVSRRNPHGPSAVCQGTGCAAAKEVLLAAKQIFCGDHAGAGPGNRPGAEKSCSNTEKLASKEIIASQDLKPAHPSDRCPSSFFAPPGFAAVAHWDVTFLR